eukprot:m51a1_g3776 ADP-ribose diphosphatase, putative (216) ;mRNA; r:150780-151479
MGDSREVRKEVLAQGQWLRFYLSHYRDERDPAHIRPYECFERHRTPPGGLDGVDVVATVRRQGHPDCVVVIEQYRPPVSRMCIEFPAGCVDDADRGTPGQTGDGAVAAAVRELREETGFVAGPGARATPLLHADPSITSDNTRFVFVDVDGDAPENRAPAQKLEEDENISVRLVPIPDLLSTLDKYAEKGFVIDVKVYCMAMGMAYGLHGPPSKQ